MRENSKEVALVTGVGRREGIGFELCRQLGAKQFTVILSARNIERAQVLAAELSKEGLQVYPLELDVADGDGVAAVATHIANSFGRLDVLVNNAAGVAPYGEKVETADLAIAHSVLETTLFGAWQLSRALLPLLRMSPNGRIVNVSSGAGSHGDLAFGLTTNNGMGTSYAVSKAALNALTAQMAHEEASPGVRINAVCPGFTATFPGGEAMGARPVKDGAASILWACTIAREGPTGGFFRDGKPLPW